MKNNCATSNRRSKAFILVFFWPSNWRSWLYLTAGNLALKKFSGCDMKYFPSLGDIAIFMPGQWLDLPLRPRRSRCVLHHPAAKYIYNWIAAISFPRSCHHVIVVLRRFFSNSFVHLRIYRSLPDPQNFGFSEEPTLLAESPSNRGKAWHKTVDMWCSRETSGRRRFAFSSWLFNWGSPDVSVSPAPVLAWKKSIHFNSART